MVAGKYFRPKKPDVVYELFEDEIILINLANGNYYSLQGTAAEIWRMMESGLSAEAAAERLGRSYRGRPEEIRRAVETFLEETAGEGLIEPVEAGSPGPDEGPAERAPAGGATVFPEFVRPELSRYTDMQELLLLDPIHEVSDQGWPNRRADDSPAEE
jgi:hypothetical protein